jgi:hypothetical protein
MPLIGTWSASCPYTTALTRLSTSSRSHVTKSPYVHIQHDRPGNVRCVFAFPGVARRNVTWVKCWTTWIITQYNTGLATTDERYWNEIRLAFQASFQDTASRERAEDKLRHLAFIPGDVDTFIAQFESLALEATYELNTKPTMSLFASKLPFKMMDHVYKVACPQDFQQWTDAVRQYHQDNTAVQNIRGIYKDTPKKQSSQKKGFSAAELAKILGVKMPTPDPNTMDTRADRSRVFNRNRGTKGHAGTTTTDPIEKQHKEGRCFTCGKQGHIARVCPDKDKDKKGKAPVKSRKAQTEDSGTEGDGESSDEEGTTLPAAAYVRLGRSIVTFPPHVTSASAIEKGKWLEWRDAPERTDSSGSNGPVEPDLDLDEEESFIVGRLVSADVIEHETDHVPDYGAYGVMSGRLALS